MSGTTELASLDTNVLLRLILGDVPAQFERARRLISRRGAYFLIPDLAIAEVIYVLKDAPDFAHKRSLQVEVIKELLSVQRLDYDEELFSQVFDLYETHPALPFDDCYLVAKAESLDRLPLYTFDKKLAGQAEGAQLVPAV
ncbi:PIN domain-containing protein [Candidatus Saccharibacteria bacterium]|nr:PIN domain-containing protein [Candidatus Saccharibacteria bacterium]